MLKWLISISCRIFFVFITVLEPLKVFGVKTTNYFNGNQQFRSDKSGTGAGGRVRVIIMC